jgi:uncharacterized protein (TIRG00374 family)
VSLKPKTKKILKTSTFTLIGAFVIFLIFRNTDFSQLYNNAKQANVFWLIAAMMVGMLGHWIRAARWKIMLNSLNYKVKTYPGFLSVISGYFINLAIPRAGEISRCALMSGVSGVPVQTLIGTVVTERIIDLIMTVFIIFSVLFLQFDLLFEFTNRTLFTPLMDKLNPIVSNGLFWPIFIVALIIFFLGIRFLLFKRKKYEPGQSKLTALLKGFADGLQSIFKLKNPTYFIIMTFGIWFTYLLSTFCILQAFIFSTGEGLLKALSVLLFSTIGVIIPAPGGVGSIWVTQNGLIEIYNYTLENATLIGSMLFFVQVIGFVILGTFALIHLGILKNKKNAASGI